MTMKKKIMMEETVKDGAVEENFFLIDEITYIDGKIILDLTIMNTFNMTPGNMSHPLSK